MRRRDAICAGTDLDAVPARARRQEQASQDEAEAVGAASPVARCALPLARLGLARGAKRKPGSGQARRLLRLRQRRLIPYLKGLAQNPNANPRQKVISETLSGVEKTRVDTERNLLDVLDKVDALNLHAVDDTHMFPLSQVYEGLLLKMGEKGNDGGQFFTPREVIRAMVRAVDPKVGETIYDPGCGTGGFLAQAFEHMRSRFNADATVDQIETLARAPSTGARRKTSSIRSRSPIWCCTASTSRTSGTATR